MYQDAGTLNRRASASSAASGKLVFVACRYRSVVKPCACPAFACTNIPGTLGDSLEVFVRREDAERFIEEVRGDDPEIAAKLRIEERKLEGGGLN